MERHAERATLPPATGVLSGSDAWSREAQGVRALATHLRVTLDEQEFALLDVRDLQALRRHIPRCLQARRTGTGWIALPGLARRVRLAGTPLLRHLLTRHS
jgi:hypothetical protein